VAEALGLDEDPPNLLVPVSDAIFQSIDGLDDLLGRKVPFELDVQVSRMSSGPRCIVSGGPQCVTVGSRIPDSEFLRTQIRESSAFTSIGNLEFVIRNRLFHNLSDNPRPHEINVGTNPVPIRWASGDVASTGEMKRLFKRIGDTSGNSLSDRERPDPGWASSLHVNDPEAHGHYLIRG
jgi:hypothetical protein